MEKKSPHCQIYKIAASGGDAMSVSSVPESQDLRHCWPEVLPNGKALLFTQMSASDFNYETATIESKNLETGEQQTVLKGSIYAKVMGRRWPWLMGMHIYYFDKKTIIKYLEKAGLELVKIETYKHTISFDYLIYKLKFISLFLHNMVSLFKKIFRLKENYITIGLGDFMCVYAKAKE